MGMHADDGCKSLEKNQGKREERLKRHKCEIEVKGEGQRAKRPKHQKISVESKNRMSGGHER